MESEKNKNSVTENISLGLRYFVAVSLGLMLFILLMRAYEVIYIWPSILSKLPEMLRLFRVLFYDLITFLYMSALTGLFFIIFFQLHKLTAKIVLITILTLVTLTALMLMLYFSRSNVPLGSDLFGYSLFEINETVRAAGGLSVLNILILAAAVVTTVLIFILFSRIKINKFFVKIFCMLAAISFLFSAALNPQPDDFSNTTDYSASVNKLQFFTSKSYTYFFEKEMETPIFNFYIESEDSTEVSVKYTDSNYPFLHEENAPDVLSSFFNVSDERPNMVFIITESLGRGYSGESAYLGSYTPFLDSLAKQSLYWDNFLSTGGRTFAVLPSMFGSLPFGEKGFLEMGGNTPDHFTLIKYLKKYGYKVTYYYGGDSRFDQMDEFLRRQKADLIIDERNFGNGYKKMPSGGSGFSWGYGDKELFRRGLEIIGQTPSQNQLNIFLTLSMHSPFLVENMDYYRDKFEKVSAANKLTPETLSAVRNYKDMLACVLYTDEAFREFINKYKKREDFKNTIFFITGDHRMPEIPIKDQLDRFHVPLIIYSPMLKRAAKFSSVSSHFDLTPSLIPFLANHYQMEKVTQSTFIGTGLDTTREFRNVHRYPLMRNKNELLDYLYKDYLYSDKTLYRLLDNLGIVPVEDTYMENVISNELSDFRKRNDMMIKTKRLIPEALLK